jgi:branched-chain amino acid transport system ATP-binding protein
MPESTGLNLQHVTMRFGGLTAVGDLSAQVGPNDLVGLIGPNGAGKTTVFNAITGVYCPTEGEVLFNGKSLNGKRPNQITRHGIARTFQNIRLFKGMTVYDNIRVSLTARAKYRVAGSIMRLTGFYREEKEVERYILELLEIFGLAELQDELATSLPYGDQRRLEIVRALATRPQMLLLDEPAAGMNPAEKQALMNLIRRLREEFKIGILLIEHDMKLVMGVCERVMVLDYGVKIAEGTPQEISQNPKVIEAYLGEVNEDA